MAMGYYLKSCPHTMADSPSQTPHLLNDFCTPSGRDVDCAVPRGSALRAAVPRRSRQRQQ